MQRRGDEITIFQNHYQTSVCTVCNKCCRRYHLKKHFLFEAGAKISSTKRKIPVEVELFGEAFKRFSCFNKYLFGYVGLFYKV